MPWPDLDLMWSEELAEVTEVLTIGHLSRYGPREAPFPAKIPRLAELVAGLSETTYALTVSQTPPRPMR